MEHPQSEGGTGKGIGPKDIEKFWQLHQEKQINFNKENEHLGKRTLSGEDVGEPGEKARTKNFAFKK